MIATTPEIDAAAFRPFEATTPAAAAKSEDQAGFLRRLASRLGADPRDERAETPEGLARLGAERLVSTALLEPLVREARESSEATGLFAPGAGEKRFGHLLDREIADSIAASRDFAPVNAIEKRVLSFVEKALRGGDQPTATNLEARA